jgi:hypothetical protein
MKKDHLKTFCSFDNMTIPMYYLLHFKQYICKTEKMHVRDRMVVGFTTTYVISAYHH